MADNDVPTCSKVNQMCPKYVTASQYQDRWYMYVSNVHDFKVLSLVTNIKVAETAIIFSRCPIIASF